MVGPIENVPTSTSPLADSLASVADHLAGDTDEAAGRAAATFRPGWEPTRQNRGWADHLMGRVDESMAEGADERAIDAVFTGHWGDSSDMVGPSTSTVADAAVSRQGERHGPKETKFKLLAAGAATVGALWLLRPYAEAAGGDGGGDG